MTDTTPDARLQALEEHVTHQAATIEELSSELRRQGLEVDRLKRRLALVLEAAAQASPDAPPLGDQRPPHY